MMAECEEYQVEETTPLRQGELIREFELLIQNKLSGMPNPGDHEKGFAVTANVLAPIAAIIFYFIGRNASQEITKSSKLQKAFVVESVFANLFSAKFSVQNSLQEWCRPGIFDRLERVTLARKRATRIASLAIATAVAITNIILAFHGEELSAWKVTLDIVSGLIGSFSMYYGANTVIRGGRYLWNNYVDYYLFKDDEGKRLYKIRNALHDALSAKLSNSHGMLETVRSWFRDRSGPSLLEKILCNNDDDQASVESSDSSCKLGVAFDALAVVIMCSTVTGYVYQTATNIFDMGAKVHDALGGLLATLATPCAAVGYIGFDINAGLNLRPTLLRLYEGIVNKDIKMISSTAVGLVGMPLSGTSGYEANYLTWKGVNETAGIIFGYIGLVGCGVVNTVYGIDALYDFLDEVCACCETDEARNLIATLRYVHQFCNSLSHMPDAGLKGLIQSGQISENMLQSLGMDESVYKRFLPAADIATVNNPDPNWHWPEEVDVVKMPDGAI